MNKTKARWIWRLLIVATFVAIGFWLVGLHTESTFDGNAVQSVRGHLYAVPLKTNIAFFEIRNDSNSHPTTSKARLYEGRTELGPPHSLHEEIATLGKGRYSHWQDALYFSASDNSDARANGRTYRLSYRLYLQPWIPTLLALASCIGFFLGGWDFEQDPLLKSSVCTVKSLARRGLKTIILYEGGALWVVRLLIVATLVAYGFWFFGLRTGTVLDASAVQSVGGHLYVAPLRTNEPFVEMGNDSNSDPTVSKARLFEGPRELGPPHSEHEQIGALGRGRFSHWQDKLYFSASDNSDPRTNGRRYSLIYRVYLESWIPVSLGLVSLIGFLVLTALRGEVDPLIGRPARAVIDFGRLVANSPLLVNGIIAIIAGLALIILNFEFYHLTQFLPLFVPDSGGYLQPGDIRGWLIPAYFQFLHWLDSTGRIFVPVQLNLMVLSFAGLGFAVTRVTGKSFWGWCVFFMCAFSIPLLANALFISSESTFVAASCAYISCALLSFRRRSVRWLLLAGVAAGVAGAARPIGLSFVLGIPLLTIVANKSVPIKGLLFSIIGAATALILANLPGMIYPRHSVDTITGLAVLGQVLPFAEGDIPSKYPHLMRTIEEKIATDVTTRNASFPRELWLRSTNDYNTILWKDAAPILYSFVEARRQQGNAAISVNGVAWSLAISIMLNQPAAYVRLIGAQMYGLWAAFFYPAGPLPQMVASWIPGALKTYHNISYAPSYFGLRGYTLAAAHQELELTKGRTWWIEVIGSKVDTALFAANYAFPVLSIFFFLVFVYRMIAGLGFDQKIAATVFCSAQVWLYAAAVGASQPALGRYSIVLEPLIVTVFVLAIAIAVPRTLLPTSLWRGSKPSKPYVYRFPGIRQILYVVLKRPTVMTHETSANTESGHPTVVDRNDIISFFVKTIIVLVAIFAVVTYANFLVQARIDELANIGGRKFWSKVEQELDRLADPAAINPKKRADIIGKLRAASANYAPFIKAIEEGATEEPNHAMSESKPEH